MRGRQTKALEKQGRDARAPVPLISAQISAFAHEMRRARFWARKTAAARSNRTAEAAVLAFLRESRNLRRDMRSMAHGASRRRESEGFCFFCIS
jgi:hypothetical protein